MNIIQVKISEDRSVEFEKIHGGTIGENEATELKFIVPEEYRDFYKYLDIIKSDGTKTQTVVDFEESRVFYYTIPYSLTYGSQIYIQLVAKKENKVFKSNVFTVYFNGSIDATQVLLSDYQDTIEFLMENKADNSEINLIYKKMEEKISDSQFSEYGQSIDKALDNKVDKEPGKQLTTWDYTYEDKVKLASLPTRKELGELLKTRVEKEEGKGLSSNDYTNEDKEKLLQLPSKEGLDELLLTKVSKEDGKTLSSNDYTNEDKEKLSALPTNEELEKRFLTIPTDVTEIKNNVSNGILKKQSDETLIIDDISSVDHNIKVKIHGKNLFDFSKASFNRDYNTIEETETGLKVNVSQNGDAQSIRMWIPFDGFEVGKTYTMSFSLVSNNMGIHLVDRLYQTTGVALGAVTNSNKYTFTVSEERAYLRIYIYNNKNTTIGDVYYLDNFQIEEGEEITEYKNFISPENMTVTVNEKVYTPGKDGNVENVISVYPQTEITSDTPEAVISCEYIRDINKVIEELTNAIISLGGNI